jgi:hypothetical protein
MAQMLAHQTYIYHLARFLHQNGTTMSLRELASHLNRNEIKSPAGEFSTSNMLGMGQAVAAVYRRVEEFFGEEEAGYVASAFVGDDGTPAWKE